MTSQGGDKAEASRQSGSSTNGNGHLPAPKHKGAGRSPTRKKPSGFKKIWTALELDTFTILLLAKGGIPPALALALLQVTVIANHFNTIGSDGLRCAPPDEANIFRYLVAIISVVGMAILPRAKFIQTLITDVVLICIAAAFALLVGYCSTQARAHTSTMTPQSARGYNSSASAVCAIWLFFQVYIANAARAKYPQLQLPVVIYSIFSVVSCINLPLFLTMPAVIVFIKRLLEAFLTGLACATAVSLLVLPVTVRQVVSKEMAGYVGLLQKCLKSHEAYLRSLEDPRKLEKVMVTERGADYKPSAEITGLNATVAAIAELHGKLQGDLPFAKREIAFGKLDATALGSISKHLRRIMLPTVGMTAMNELLERTAVFHGWTQEHLDGGLTKAEELEREAILHDWTNNLTSLRISFETIIAAMCEGLEHSALQLELKKRPKSARRSSADDVEAKAQGIQPGDRGFTEHLERTVERHHTGKKEMLHAWCHRHGIELPVDFFEQRQTSHLSSFVDEFAGTSEEVHHRNQRQLYLLLYMDFLIWSSAKAVLSLVRYSDELVANGTMSRKQLIVPGWRRLKKWMRTFLNAQEGPIEESRGDLGDFDQAATLVDLGSAYNEKKDPEHLPAESVLEKIGDSVRWIPRLLRSDPSLFGFRVAVATMSIAIIGYLGDTQRWFVVHRVLWAIIMVAISMTPTAGQSVFSFSLRILGTIVAMVAAFICYYVPDKHRAGVIVLLWLFTSIGTWVPLKRPQMAIVGIISIVTNVLIIGYTLEVEKIGERIATSNGQEYLPIYKLGAYRLATVCGGLLVAFIFTIFPFPITEHSLLRQNAGGALYLLANYYSVVHESVQARIKDVEGDPNNKNSLGVRLKKIRAKVFTKQMLMLTNLRSHSAFQKFEIPVGGRFPKRQYDKLIESVSSITRYVALLSYSSESLVEDGGNDHHLSQWSRDLKTLIGSIEHTSHDITSMLSLLSASVTNGQPLPPYMKAPEPFYFSRKLEALDPDILSIRHIDEPEYAVFAVFQIASRCIIFELETLLRTVRGLVGELDFSFHVVRTANSSQTVVDEQRSSEGKRKGD